MTNKSSSSSSSLTTILSLLQPINNNNKQTKSLEKNVETTTKIATTKTTTGSSTSECNRHSLSSSLHTTLTLPTLPTLTTLSISPSSGKLIEIPTPHQLQLQILSSSSTPSNGETTTTTAKQKKTTTTTTSQTTSSSLKARPLNGNLSDKLTEYTRGGRGAGVMGMFRPGGAEDDEYNRRSSKKEKEGEETTTTTTKEWDEEEARRAEDCLDVGDGREAWKRGLILKGDLTLRHVYGDEEEDDEEKGEEEEEMMTNDVTTDEVVVNEGSNDDVDDWNLMDQRPAAAPEGITWDNAFWDDDSLFGSSIDSSSSSDDDEDSSNDENDDSGDDDEDEGDDATEKATTNEVPSTTPTTTAINTPSSSSSSAPPDHDDDNDDLVTLDALLSSLSLTTGAAAASSLPSFRHMKKITTTTPRKSYAVTTTLPLSTYQNLDLAMTHPFTLDDFQKQAVMRLEQRQSIFLSAHTSAGKTVVAEYAIALSQKHCTRTIYTSPIKALSNQKYRDFTTTFGPQSVGLITGDTQINPDAPCLVMTTEILRSMLYRGADLVRDIEWVIFDEVHYINDVDRGVVWEEVIIMLPEYVGLVFLSATTPNTLEFSDWIGRTKRRSVFVIKTNYRPVPLRHYIYVAQGGETKKGGKLCKIREGDGGFWDKGWSEAKKLLAGKAAAAKDDRQRSGGGGGGRGPMEKWMQQGNRQNWTSLVKFLEREGLMPTVVFSFSKKKCEEIANMIRSLTLTTSREISAIQSFTRQTTTRLLSPSDANLPQVRHICDMVTRGIGIHHGGLLPILKEMVEILFSRNLIKILFATETFAMGVNMPARAVVFNGLRKHDGVAFRPLEPGEYTQMAGRAGRRGLDKVGTVIITAWGEEPPPLLTLKTMLTGQSTSLKSQFRLTYNMILNLLRVEDMSVEGMIQRSFSEFATQRALAQHDYPRLLKRGEKALRVLEERERERRSAEEDEQGGTGADDMEEYYSTSVKVLALTESLGLYLLRHAGVTGGGAFVPGRVLLVTSARTKGYVKTPAILLKAPVVGSGSDGDETAGVGIVLLPESYLPEADNKTTDDGKTKNSGPGMLNYVGMCQNRYYVIQEIELKEILLISNLKHKIDVKTLYKETNNTSSSSLGGSSKMASSFFGTKKPMTRERQLDDPFAGFVSRGKNKINANSSSSSYLKLADQIILHLLSAETLENTTPPTHLPPLDLKDCIKQIHQNSTETFQFRSSLSTLHTHLTHLRSLPSHTHNPHLTAQYTTVEKTATLRSRVNDLRHLLSNESLRLFPDFLQRKRLLQTLGYVSQNDDTVGLKGRVACEVNTADELISTEMVFEGLLNDLEPEEIVAVLSALIFQEKGDDDDGSALMTDESLPATLRQACESTRDVALRLGRLQKQHGLDLDPYEYCQSSLKFGIVRVVYEWARGVPFSDICELTLVQEGSIVRCMTRLDELCREVRNCARVVGNPTLYRKCEEGSRLIKRDIVFASSLYVS